MEQSTTNPSFRVPDEAFTDVGTVFALLRDHPPQSERELLRFYRRGIRLLHPDRCGDDGSRCVEFQQLYASFEREWRERRLVSAITLTVDPYQVLRDVGIEGEISSRAALFVALYRFRSLGLDRWKVRTRIDLKKRNERIIRSLFYWAYRYDRWSVATLRAFLLQSRGFAIREGQVPLYYYLRKLVFRALNLLIRYQDNRREATRSIAIDLLNYAQRLCPREMNGESSIFSSISDMRGWLRAEFDRSPERIGLDL